jgi:imidazole glycerol phosphate synthase glutamine amidotransferase subunit
VPQVVVVKTGIANLASVQAGLRRAGAESIVSDDPAAVRGAGHVMLPGVGAFGAAMEVLQGDLGAALIERIAANRPTLAICLGLQLLCVSSEESPGVAGLGVLDAGVTRYPDSVMVPQMGWAKITADPAAHLLESGYVYFANSYRLEGAPDGWRSATGEHAGTYVAAVERGNVLACQFHPELSGAYGKHLLRRWIELEAT